MLDFSHLSQNNQQILYATNGSWQIWQKPRGASFIQFFLLGGGGGGGGGQLTASARNGAGGGSGAQCILTFPASFIPDILYVNVGVGGTAGPINTGLAGNGTASYVTIYPATTVNYILCQANPGGGAQSYAAGGLGAAGSVTTIAQAPLAGLGFPAWGQAATNISLAGQAGTLAGNGANAGGDITLPTTGLRVTGGAGAGGNGAAGSAGLAGGRITAIAGSVVYPAQIGGTAGGTTTNGGAGSNGFQAISNLLQFYGGTGGGSGGRNAITTGGVGGAGGYGCGGGGGGGANTGGTASPGGGGGDGLCIITWW